MPPRHSSSAAIEIFYSYSHKDAALRDELDKHLSVLDRSGIIREWHDGDIGAGMEWPTAINEHLESARIILLLISPDFVNSEYCYGVEAKRAMERHESGEALVIPIILRPVDWQSAPFGKLQVLPTDGKPVTRWSDKEEAFLDIARGIRSAVEEITDSSPTDAKPSIPVWNVKPNVPELLPYLCNRSDQELELCAALTKHQQLAPRRPFICFVHGNQDECHSDFLRRVQQTSLASLLNLKQRQLSVEPFALKWPTSARQTATFERSLWSNLGDELLGNITAATDEILQFISAHEKPLMFTSHLLAEDFAAASTNTLSAFMHFWNNWPDLPPGRTVISCVCLYYQTGESFFERWKMRKTNDQLRRFITQLDFNEFESLHGVVLPELTPVRHGDVLDWIHKKDVKRVCNIREKDVSGLFGRSDLLTHDGHIRMVVLADQLKTLAQRCRI